jgi:hypothetical protein
LFFTPGQSGSGGDPNPDSDHALLKRSADGGATWTTVSNVAEVYDVGFGAAAPGESYPAIYIAGWVSVAEEWVWGVWRSIDSCASWTQIGNYPNYSLDHIRAVAGDPDIYGRVYLGLAGSGYLYGDVSP